MSTSREYSAPEPAARNGTWVPIAVAVVAGLLVLGLLASILLTPAKSDGTTAAGLPPAGVAPSSGNNAEALRVGALAPNFTLTSLQGQPVQLSSFRGVRPVWVNFWATWCGFCKIEMPQMQKLYNSYKDRGLEILGVDDQESQAAVQQYVQGTGYSWKFVLDQSGQVSRQYQLRGLPTHVFINRQGTISGIVIGGIEETRMVSELAKIMSP